MIEFFILLILFLIIVLPMFRGRKKESDDLDANIHYQERKRLIEELRREEEPPPPPSAPETKPVHVPIAERSFSFKTKMEKRSYENRISQREFTTNIGSVDLISEGMQEHLSVDSSYAQRKQCPSRIGSLMNSIGPKRRAMIMHELLKRRH